jgi:hypothetical protein
VLGAVNVLSFRDGRISRINGFVDPAMFAGAGLPERWPERDLPGDR